MVFSVPDVNFRQRSPILFAITVAILAATGFRFRRWRLATFVADCAHRFRHLFGCHVVRTLFVGRAVFHKHEPNAIEDFHKKASRVTRLSLSLPHTTYTAPTAPIHPRATRCDTPPPLVPSCPQCGQEGSRSVL